MPDSLTLAEAAQHYLEMLEQQGKHQRTIYTYHRDLAQIQAFFGEARQIHTITLPLMGRFLKSEELLMLPNGSPRAKQTTQKTIRVFRMLLIWLQQTGALPEINLELIR